MHSKPIGAVDLDGPLLPKPLGAQAPAPTAAATFSNALGTSEGRHGALVNQAKVGIAELDEAGRFIFVNDHYCRLFGYTSDELLRMRIQELTGEDFPAVHGHEPGPDPEWQCRNKDGTEIWISNSVAPVVDAEGTWVSTVCVSSDVTARKRAEQRLIESELRFRSMLEKSGEEIILLDAAGRITYESPREMPLLGFATGEMTGEYGLSLVHPEDLPLAQAKLAEAMQGPRNTSSGELRMKTKHGGWRWIRFDATNLLHDPAVKALVVNLRDITERKCFQEEILQLNATLEERVGLRTQELSDTVAMLRMEIQMRKRLEREILEISEREHDRFGRDVHDGLGQELAGIAMLSNVLAADLRNQDHPSAEAAANIAAYIRQVIDSAKTMARGHYPIQLKRAGLLAALEELAEHTSTRFRVRCTVCGKGDPPALEESASIHVYRIVQECISNAIKHGRATHIVIESASGEPVPTLSVTDNGVGFHKPKDSAGMGLHLMEYRARGIGGEVTIEKPAEGGCRVSLRFPALQP